MRKNTETSVFEQIKAGLEDSIAYSKGELSLVTTHMPAPPPKTNAKAISSLRRSLHMSQALFAATLNVSKRTVQSWEQGVREPGDASLRLLQIIRTQPHVVRMILADSSRKGRQIARAGNGTQRTKWA